MKHFRLPDCLTFRSFLFFLTGLPLIPFFVSCSGGNGGEPKPSIDVSMIWATTRTGDPANMRIDKQWESKTFSAAEMKLFAGLDTVNLAGTTMPLKVTGPGITPDIPSMAYPNPFITYFNIPFAFDSSFSGSVILKLVIVDQSLHPVLTQVVRLTAKSSRSEVRFWPEITVGNFRLYYTFSAQSNPHFHKSWGNIKKTL